MTIEVVLYGRCISARYFWSITVWRGGGGGGLGGCLSIEGLVSLMVQFQCQGKIKSSTSPNPFHFSWR